MGFFDSVEQVAKDVIYGDFSQSGQDDVAADIIAALISLIPVLGDIMGARDVAASVFRINREGGFAKASIEDKVGLAFNAFSLLPEIGGPFKHVFEPLYRERRVEGTVLHTGTDMIEHMLGMSKGGAVRWIKAFDWVGKTQMVILKIQATADLCIQFLQLLADQPWWCPRWLSNEAKGALPGIQNMRSQIAQPIQEAVEEIKKFLTQLLGEHAAAIAVAVGENVVASGAIGSHKGEEEPTRKMHGEESEPAAKTHPKEEQVQPPTAKYKQVEDEDRVKAEKGEGEQQKSTISTAFDKFRAVTNLLVKGLIGEHVVDYYCMEHMNWGVSWNEHDWQPEGGGWAGAGTPGAPRKVNEDHPVYLCLPEGRVAVNGIDLAYRTNRAKGQNYSIVEAKFSMNALSELYPLLGQIKDPEAAKDTVRKPGHPITIMQMSHKWIKICIQKDEMLSPRSNSIILGGISGVNDRRNYSRHVMLVSPAQAGAADHMIALEQIEVGAPGNDPKGAQKFAHLHAVHDARKFTEQDLDNAEAKFVAAGGASSRPSKQKGKGGDKSGN